MAGESYKAEGNKAVPCTFLSVYFIDFADLSSCTEAAIVSRKMYIFP